jgi:hypothetical protein
MSQFSEDELEVLSALQESVSALCCAAAYILQADGVWDHFRHWLIGQAESEDAETASMLSQEVTPESMKFSLMQADHFLMMAEGVQVFSSPEFIVPWFADDEGTAPEA